tara:strand:- start:4989 stop:5171 length:183 start_codon:yes stop_codon:yes gene_type:complete
MDDVEKQKPIREVATLMRVLVDEIRIIKEDLKLIKHHQIQKERIEKSKIDKVEQNAGWFG